MLLRKIGKGKLGMKALRLQNKKTVLFLALLFFSMFVPLVTIKNVSATIDPNPLPTDDYPYFNDGLHQWLFENTLDDTGLGATNYYLLGTGIYNTSVPQIRTGTTTRWYSGSTHDYNATFLDDWRTDYGASGWGLSVWFYCTSSQSWKRIIEKVTDTSPTNYISILPNRVTLSVDGTTNYKDFSYLQNIWNQIIVTQASNGTTWVWVNGVREAFWTDFNDVVSDNDGSGNNFTVGATGTPNNWFKGCIDDIRFYGEELNQTYADYLWTAPDIPSSGDWLIDADTELWNEDNITITDGSIIIGEETPDRECDFTAYNTNFYFNASDNEEGILGDGVRADFINLTEVNVYNATDKWLQHTFYYFSELHLTDVYLQHVGNDAINKEGLRIVPGSAQNKPIRLNGITLYDVNGTGIAFYSCDVEDDVIVNDVNITRYSNDGISLGSSFGSAPQGGTFTDIYIYTDLPSLQAIVSYGENLVWDDLELVGHHLLAPHKLFQWQGDNTIIQNSLFRDCDNGIWLSSADHTLYVYDSIIENCADGFDSGAGTVYAYNVTFDGTRDRAISMEPAGATFYLSDCSIINTVEGQHDIYYRSGNITFINTFFSQPYSSPVGDYSRNIFQHWNFSTSDVYVNCTTIDDESNLNVAIQSTTWVVESEVPKLTIEVDAPGGTSEIIVYCGDNGIPSSIYIKGVEINTWTYDDATQLATITVTHTSEETIIVFWSDLATMGSIVGAVFILLLIGITLIGVLLMRRRR